MRFNLTKPVQRQAWEYLQAMDKIMFKSYSNVIAVSLVHYFEQYYKKQADPYLETREREEQFVEKIVEAVAKTAENAIPKVLATCLSEWMQPYQEQRNFIPRPGKTDDERQSAAEQEIAENLDWDFLGD